LAAGKWRPALIADNRRDSRRHSADIEVDD
jgi:hypothetical protein